MAALSSYTPIATNTLTADGQTVTFSSIPATYTDLVLVINATAVSTGLDISMRFNSDTASNYSRTLLSGNGTSATSNRESNMTSTQINNISLISSTAAAYTGIVNIFNYANTTTFKSIISRSNNAASGVEAVAHLWRKTPEAIHTITLTSTATRDMKIGSSFSLYGIANNTAGAKATGGVISSDSSYFYHSFYATGTFTPTQSLSCDYLVVAGGGGGGNNFGGGGGAGGYRTSIGSSPLSVTATGYTITVGAGGNTNSKGSNSVFSSITSTGGGLGGGRDSVRQAGSGGSGGGAGGEGGGSGLFPNGGAGNEGSYSPVEGYSGANSAGSGNTSTGGGGGASQIGQVGSVSGSGTGGAGGTGLSSVLDVSGRTIAGGGGGSGGYGTGGAATGGGGAGSGGTFPGYGTAGTANTGGGGGGGYASGAGGAAGGSGVVIIRYAR